MTPADWVIQNLGGVRATARAIGLTPSAVSKWQTYVNKNGEVGGVPRSSHAKILKLANKLNLDVTAEDLVHGRSGSKQRK